MFPSIGRTSDPTIATISNTGTLICRQASGALSPSRRRTEQHQRQRGRDDCPPAGIVLVSGGGQTGRVGALLGQPGVVRVTASDGVGVSGVAVNFAAPTGGKVGSATALYRRTRTGMRQRRSRSAASSDRRLSRPRHSVQRCDSSDGDGGRCRGDRGRIRQRTSPRTRVAYAQAAAGREGRGSIRKPAAERDRELGRAPPAPAR